MLVQESAWSDGNIIEAQGSLGNTIFKVGGNPNDIEIPNDTSKLKLGAGGDLEIYHDGTSSYIDNDTGWLNINTATGGIQINKDTSEYMGRFIVDGATELYYDNSKKLDTNSGGVKIHGNLDVDDNNKLRVGTSSDLQIYHDGTHSYINNNTGRLNINNDGSHIYLQTDNNIYLQTASTENALIASSHGAVELYYDNSKKLETASWGVNVTGNIDASGNLNVPNDTGKVQLGASNDLQIYHDGSNSYIDRKAGGTGDIYMRLGTDNALVAKTDGSVELHYNGGANSSFKTTSYGSYTSGQFRINNWSGSQGLWVGRSDADPGAAVGVQVNCDSTKSFIKSYGQDLRIQIAAVDGTASNALIIDQATKDAEFYGNITLTGTQPAISFVDSNHNDDFKAVSYTHLTLPTKA